MTKKEIRDDIILQLTQGAPSDDLELSESQIDYWIDVTLNTLVANECNEKLKRGQMIPEVYIKKASCEAGTYEEDDCGDQNRVYFQLDESVLNINNGGILRIITDDGTEIRKASIQTLSLFNAMRFAKPSVNNLIYSHETNKIYVEGLEEPDILFDKIHIWYVPKQDILGVADTYEVLVSDLTLPMLISACVETGKRQLYGTTQDTSNDGVDNKDIVYHTAISNPNQ